LEPLMRVRLAQPAMVGGYCLIAETWLMTEAVTADAFLTVSEGVRLFPTHPELARLAAALERRLRSSPQL
jgi:hypothetical protein